MQLEEVLHNGNTILSDFHRPKAYFHCQFWRKLTLKMHTKD